jgi:SAM-dependent methyltransferase
VIGTLAPVQVLAETRCTACGESALRGGNGEWAPDAILPGAIECKACGAVFDVIWGFPFLGHYEPEDILGLIEIAANAREDNAYASRGDVERLERLLFRYDKAEDKDAFQSSCTDEFLRAPWFGNRYSEYTSFHALAGGIELADRDVLDVGAGSGHDTWRLVRAGGRVTALEYNPMLIRRGQAVVPEARWIGGFAHVLPFENETFDVVCCNAALHHMRDVPTAMREMLRVIRPGGWLLTTGDPFRADHAGEELEFDVFNEHADVLLGVNESIPRFSTLVEPLLANRSRLDVTLLTSDLWGAKPWRARRRFRARGREEWSLAAGRWLSKTSGSVSIRAHVRRSLSITPATQQRSALAAGEYARVLFDYDTAVSSLLRLLPRSHVDADFPGGRQTKFELLNGWQKPLPDDAVRTGYRRARWFLTRPGDVHSVQFRVRGLGSSANSSMLQVYVGGRLAATTPLAEAWSDVAVRLDPVRPSARFVCELRAIPDDPESASFDDYRFAVRDRHFV